MDDLISRRIAETDLILCLGDITTQTTDAIVNAANSALCGGGGVDGAIHRAGGPSILKECQDYVRKHGPLPPGRAMWTSGGSLPARYVIHTVGPIYKSERESAPILKSAYVESLRLAETLQISSLSFPSISTGAYGYPVAAAARVALRAVVDHLREGSPLKQVQIVCFTTRVFGAFTRALENLT
jgi:O-acetyl-ADP-ribose deacetylase (regulator of RNase III)